MSKKTITLDIPDDLYQRIEQAAEGSERSLESVMLESLGMIFDANLLQNPEDVDQLEQLADAQLWAIVHRRIHWSDMAEMRQLMTKSKGEELADAEHTRLQELLNVYDTFVLYRSVALRLLKERGYDVDRFLQQTAL